jgi:cupin fold WbuC family metalloprotein
LESLAIKHITQELFNTLAEQASHHPRLRQNYNFHELSEKVQRFLNVLQPGTYVRPHHHNRPADVNGFECFLVLQGELGILIFDQNQTVIHTEHLSAQGNVRGIELAEGTVHTIVALAPNTIMFELKEGPYYPTNDKNFLAGFPLEGTSEADQCVKQWEAYFKKG